MNELDKTDRAILAAVQRDGRIPIARLADSVGLSETPCARRLKRLETEGYVERYRGQLSRKRLGYGVVWPSCCCASPCTTAASPTASSAR